MPRFVLLYHTCPPSYARPSHWDFMLEVGDTLHTWAIRELPAQWRSAHEATTVIDPNCLPIAAVGATVAAEQLGHHRTAFLEFEGTLTGDRGHVVRIDRGTYHGEPSPPGWKLELAGHSVRGNVLLEQNPAGSGKWSLTCESQE